MCAQRTDNRGWQSFSFKLLARTQHFPQQPYGPHNSLYGSLSVCSLGAGGKHFLRHQTFNLFPEVYKKRNMSLLIHKWSEERGIYTEEYKPNNTAMKEYYFIAVYANDVQCAYSAVINIHPFEWMENNVYMPNSPYTVSLLSFQKISKEEYEVWVKMEEKRGIFAPKT